MRISLELCASVMSGRVLLSILKLMITVIGLLALPAQAETIFTYRKPESDSDHRYDYDNAVLKLALEKTRKEYGNFRFQASPPMNYSRAIEDSRNKVYPNFFIKLSDEDRFAEMGLTYARFPIDLGIVDYRVCFVRSALKAQLEKTTNLAELKRYTHGQGIGWSDIQVLRHNGSGLPHLHVISPSSSQRNRSDVAASRRLTLMLALRDELSRIMLIAIWRTRARLWAACCVRALA